MLIFLVFHNYIFKSKKKRRCPTTTTAKKDKNRERKTNLERKWTYYIIA
jgi:hypothetical protein